MVIAHHLVWTAYGHWLPNDPRGSGSTQVRQKHLADLGPTHLGRKRHQPASSDIRTFYQDADPRLKHPKLSFAEDEINRLGELFGSVIDQLGYTCYAAALMPDHVHPMIRKHRDRAEAMIDRLQERTAAGAIRELLRPTGHPVWTRGGWKTFLRMPDDVRRTVRYIERNPIEIRWSPQRWDWVRGYDGWPFHKAR